ncbi:hypothetical protein Tco_0193730 [Tanacetum coccineum]
MPNPHQPLIPYPSRLQEENFQALENPMGRADHFVYRIDIVDSLCDKFSIENNSMSGNLTPSSDYVVESPSPSLIPYEDSDSLVEETDTLLSHFNNSSPDYETFCFDIEEKSSDSTTSHSNLSLPSYESFCFDNDHQEEKRREEKRREEKRREEKRREEKKREEKRREEKRREEKRREEKRREVYAVPAGKVIIIVSPSRLNLVPTGRILSPGRVK